MNRERLLREVCEFVIRTMALRAPQAEALRALRDALARLPKALHGCTPEQRREFLVIQEGWRHPFHPTFTFALATGIGKTRLAGAIIALLWLAGEARTFLILAPRRAVLRRFDSALDPRFREYIFVDPNIVPEPSVVRADEIDGPRAFEFGSDLFANGPKIFLLSPQLIASSDRFKRTVPSVGKSPSEVLAERDDLVVLVDEAHHVGKVSNADSTSWARAIRELNPVLQLGLTATPRNEDGENVLYEYPLRRALKEGLYTKDVHICVRTFDAGTLSDDDVDRAAIEYSLDRLERKEAAVKVANASGFPATKPICVFFARDIAHSKTVSEWILAGGRVRQDELLLTHSAMSKSEEEIERLLGIERPDNAVRVVVNVMELIEGWDVTNVYVVTPLRALATFQGALQAMGRGLRLPAGRRIGQPVLDELDVVCFGREKLEKIITDAMAWTGATSQNDGFKVTSSDQADAELVPIEIEAARVANLQLADLRVRPNELNLALAPDALKGISEAVVTEVELAEARTRMGFGRPRLPVDRFTRAAALRCVRALPEFLSDAIHVAPIEGIVSDWLDRLHPGAATVQYDPAEVGELIAAALRRNSQLIAAQYENKGTLTTGFSPYIGWEEVMLAPGAVAPKLVTNDLPVFQLELFKTGRLFRGWNNSAYAACSFDSEPEALLALLLDRAQEIDWWARNSPTRLEVETPAGRYRPDFVLRLSGSQDRFVVLEAKADFRWEDPLSEPRLKHRAACEWASQQRGLGYSIEVGLVLETDIRRSSSWAELSQRIR